VWRSGVDLNLTETLFRFGMGGVRHEFCRALFGRAKKPSVIEKSRFLTTVAHTPE